MKWLDLSPEQLFSAIVLACLLIVTIVVVAGAIVCVSDQDYGFGEYLIDLANMWKVLVSALLGTLGRALAPGIARWGVTRRNGGAG